MNNTLQKTQTVISEVKDFLHSPYWFAPLNMSEQKHLFFQGTIQNPVFAYPPLPKDDLRNLEAKLNACTVDDDGSIEAYFVTRKREELVKKLAMDCARDTPQLTDTSMAFYGLQFNPQVVNQAEADVRQVGEISPNEEFVTAREAAEAVRIYLHEHYKINDWEIVTVPVDDFSIKIQPRFQKIFISDTLQLPASHLEEALVHEIDVHVVRGLNALRQQGIFRYQFPMYVKTEEGLASFASVRWTANGNQRLCQLAVFYLAALKARQESFRSVYEFLTSYGIHPELAFKRTLRMKRGFSDTSKPGLYAREGIYYEGLTEVEQYLENKGDMKRLFAGKFGLKDLEKVPVPEDIILPHQLRKGEVYGKV